jgi:hypothetical protein
MFRVLAISLDETRMSAMRKIWPGVEKFPGIVHPKIYKGCSLAHIAAVREGLKNGESHVLILEDDARPRESAVAVYAACAKATKHGGWDVLSLCASADFKISPEPVFARQVGKGTYVFEASRKIVNADAVFWSRSALPLLDEYEALLKDEKIFLPIDLMFYNNNWSVESEGGWGSEPCLVCHQHEVDGVKYWPPNLIWNQPRTVIAWPPLTYQSTEFVSAHTGTTTPDYTEHNVTLDVRLRIDPIEEKPPGLNFVIGSAPQVLNECG